MAITPFTLSTALQSIGVAEVFIGDPLVADSMVSLGATEGTIAFKAPFTQNDLTAPELTGDTPHQTTVVPGKVIITASVIMGDPALWALINPLGKASGGTSSPQAVVETGVLIIPRSELGPIDGTGLFYDTAATAGWSLNGVKSSAADPTNAIWLWRAGVSFGDVNYAYANGGKVIVEVTFNAMFDASKPEYHKIYTIGDPWAVSPTPIPVLL